MTNVTVVVPDMAIVLQQIVAMAVRRRQRARPDYPRGRGRSERQAREEAGREEAEGGGEVKRDAETTTVQVHVSRYSGSDEEITIAITHPRTETTPKKVVYVTMKPADFALALTGRGGITGELCEYVYPKAVKK